MSHLDEGQLHELLDGELDAPARATALAHLATCERCKAAYAEAAAFLAESDALIDAVQLPVGVESRKTEVESRTTEVESRKSKIDSAQSTLDFGLSTSDPQRTRRLTTMRTLAWAASMVVAVGFGWYASGFRPGLKNNPVASDVTLTALSDSPATAAAAAPLPSQSVVPERAKPGTRSADRAMNQPIAPASPAAEKAGPDDALAAAANSQPVATLAEEPKPEARGMMAQQAEPAQAPAPVPPAAFAPLASRDERRREADKEVGLSATALGGADRAAMPKQAAAPTTFPVIGMEEAVRILGGSIRLIDGLTPTRVLAGRLAGGKDVATVRVVYEDPPGRELWLDQRREASGETSRIDATTALLPGDTLMVVREAGARSLDWVDQAGFLLRLTGYVPADSLQRLQARVR